MDLSGKIALVTGAGVRLGRTIALALAEAGADLGVHYHTSAADAERTADGTRKTGRRAEVFQADLRDEAAIAKMFQALQKTFGRLDVLVNNAGVYHRTPLESLTGRQWDEELAVNARAAALCIRYALPLMAGGGAVINIADVGAEKGWGGYPAYCASKAALLGLTRSAAKALADRNIRVNAVSPGVAQWPDDATEAHKEVVLAQVPMRRAGSPADVAAAVVFLAAHDYITAQNLRVDGGWHMG